MNALQKQALKQPAKEPDEVPIVAARRHYGGRFYVLLAHHTGDY